MKIVHDVIIILIEYIYRIYRLKKIKILQTTYYFLNNLLKSISTYDIGTTIVT